MKRISKTWAAAGSAMAAAIVVGIVIAAWTLPSGTGNGYAQAGHAVALGTLDASSSVTAGLYPGENGPLTIAVNNQNPFAVKVTSLTVNVAGVTADSGHSGCTTPAITANAGTLTGLNLAVGKSTSATLTIAGALHMGDSSNGCQDATFTIPVSAIDGVSTGT